jgi:putrescine transport system substrate-binding protein
VSSSRGKRVAHLGVWLDSAAVDRSDLTPEVLTFWPLEFATIVKMKTLGAARSSGRPIARDCSNGAGLGCESALCRVVIVSWLLVIAACSKSGAPEHPPARELNIYNWSDYIAPNVLADFEKETGIKVHYAAFPSQEVMETTLLTGHTQYDVVVVPGNVLEHLIGARVFRVLDRSRMPNWRNLDTDVMARLARQDPGNRFAAAYLWGTTGIGINVSRASRILPGVPLDGWSLIYDPAIIGKLAACGVSFVDAPSEVIATVLMSMGKDPNSSDEADLEAASVKLAAIRPYIRKIDSDSQIADFAAGEICLMLTWTPNVVQAKRRASESGTHDDLRYVIPMQGTITFLDTLAIPADAPHTQEAYAFLDYLMRADIAARNANFIGNATANRAALPQIDQSLRDDSGVYPPQELQQRLEPIRSRGNDANRSVTRIWTKFRTGR